MSFGSPFLLFLLLVPLAALAGYVWLERRRKLLVHGI